MSKRLEEADPGGEVESGNVFPDPFRDFPEEAGAVFKGAAVFSRPVVGGQKLVAEVAVRVFDVDKIESGVPGDPRRLDEVLNDVADLFIGHDVLRAVVELPVEQRMRVGGFGLQNIRPVRMGVAAGVGQLETDVEIIVASECFLVDPVHLGADACQRLFRMFRDKKLLRIAPAGVHDCPGFGSVEQFGAAPRETEPAAAGEFAGGSVVHAVPALHGEDGPAVADGASAEMDRAGQRGGAVGRDFRNKADREVPAFDVLLERLDGFEFGYFPVRCHVVRSP